MCIYMRNRCICVPNMKLLCLTLCQGKVRTDANANTDANDDDTQSMTV